MHQTRANWLTHPSLIVKRVALIMPIMVVIAGIILLTLMALFGRVNGFDPTQKKAFLLNNRPENSELALLTPSRKMESMSPSDLTRQSELKRQSDSTRQTEINVRTFQRPPCSAADLSQLIASRRAETARLSPLTNTQTGPGWPVAVFLQPDPAVNRVFLLISESEQAALAFNSFFNFYYDFTNRTDSGPALFLSDDLSDDGSLEEESQSESVPDYPILILDRLFTAVDRDNALANESFSTPLIVGELQHWLTVLLDPLQAEKIQEFVLDCYRKDFKQRLEQTAELEPWEKRCQLGELEVIYHADRESYCTFSLV